MGEVPTRGGSAESIGDFARIGVVTVSDRASQGVYEDKGGPAILNFFKNAIESPWEAEYRVIPDERDVIEATLRELADEKGCCLVVTTGGTGPAPRDVTPEATEAVCGRMMPGYGEQMRAISLRHVPTAVLSRQTAGLRGKTLILNLPGKPKAIDETLPEVFVSIPACIDLMEGPYIATNDAVCPAFRPCTLKRTAKPSAGDGSGEARTGRCAEGSSVRVEMLYFAGGREAAGVSHETLEVPRGLTAAGMRDLLVGRHPALAGVVDTCVLAVDQQYVEGAGPLPFRDGCEVALIPPISGG